MADIAKAVIQYIEKMENIPAHKRQIVTDMLTALKQANIKDSQEARNNACYALLFKLYPALSETPGTIDPSLMTDRNKELFKAFEDALELIPSAGPAPRSK